MRVSLLSFLLTLCAFSQPYTISTVAGTDRVLDGSAATGVPLREPTSVAADAAGNVYIGDRTDARIRRVNVSGIITTVAGTGIPGYSGDRGKASQAQIASPSGLAIDTNGNLYFADRGNFRVRRIAPDGTINTVAGTGVAGFSGDGGPATSAQITPSDVAADAKGNLYIAEALNFRIRKVDPNGIITTFAGTGLTGYSGDNGPAAKALLGLTAALAVDSKSNVYIADITNAVVRKIDPAGVISTFAGSGQRGFIADGIPATQELMLPAGLAANTAGEVFISDVNLNRIIKVDTTGAAFTVAGNGNQGFAGDGGPAVAAEFDFPSGLALDSLGNLYIADQLNARVRKLAGGTITSIAGTGIRDGGPATSAFLAGPDGIAVNGSGQLAVADGDNFEVRKFTVGGAINASGQINGAPSGVTFDAGGNLYVTDNEPFVLKITPAGVTSIVAGNGQDGFAGDGGPATSASLSNPTGVAVDSGGNIFIADYDNQRVRRVSASNNSISTVAGNGNIKASGDNGPATAAGVDPHDVAVDRRGNLYLADLLNNRIRKVTPDGTITTVAGAGQPGHDGDGGPATLATLNTPTGVAVDAAGNLYIADNGNSAVRRVTASGLITTIAGNGVDSPSSGDGGPALQAQMDPWKVAVDADGAVYVSDLFNDRVRALRPQPATPATLTIVSGNNQSATAGAAPASPLAVKVTDASGAPLAGVQVTFFAAPSAAVLSFPSAITLPDGTASIKVTLGNTAGSVAVIASVPGVAPVTFNLISTAAISQTAPRIQAGGVVSAGLSVPPVKALSANAIATVFGANFADAGTARQVGPGDLADGKVPTQFAGICVQVGSQKAPVFSVFPGQINFQIPNVPAGNTTVQVFTKCGTAQEEKSGAEPLVIQAASPEFFYFAQNANGKNPIAALNAVTGVFVGAPRLIAGAAFAPARSRDILTLFATGFGATDPSFGPGELPGGAARVINPISVSVGGVTLDPANILYAGVTQNAGLYQLNIKLPDGLPDGDLPIAVTIAGIPSPSGAFITVKN